MKLRYSFIHFVFSVSLIAPSLGTCSDALDPEKELESIIAQQKPYCYEISGECFGGKLTAPYHILGTQHNIPLEFLPPEVLEIADKSEALVLEVSHKNATISPAFIQKNLNVFKEKYGLNPEEILEAQKEWVESLESYKNFSFNTQSEVLQKATNEAQQIISCWFENLPEKAQKLLKNQEEYYKICLKEFHPTLSYMMLTVHFSSLDFAGGMDAQFATKFDSQNKKIKALERQKDRIYTSYDLTFNTLKKSILRLPHSWSSSFAFITDEITKRETQTASVIDIFNPLTNTFLKGEEGLPLEHPGLKERNISWRSRIDEILKENRPTFIAVGLAHLPGDTGLLKYFESLGLTVKRIETKPRAVTEEMKKYLKRGN